MRLGINPTPRRNLWRQWAAAMTVLPARLIVAGGAPPPPAAAPAESASAQPPLLPERPPAQPVAPSQWPTPGAAAARALTHTRTRELESIPVNLRPGGVANSRVATSN